jgi:hypothetical protein
MKKDLSKGNKKLLPAQDSVQRNEPCADCTKVNCFVNGLTKLFQAMRRNRFIGFRKKKTNSDGSIDETEFTYRDDY